MIFDNGENGGIAGGVDVGDIGHSLRFRGSNSTYLSKSTTVTGNRRTFTWSGWVKRGTLGTTQVLFSNGAASADWLGFTSDAFRVSFTGGTTVLQTNAVYRDVGSHYHVLVSVDTTQVVAADRVKLYINGVQITSFSSAAYPAQNYQTDYNLSGTGMLIGQVASSSYFDGYISRICFIDGQALNPTSFGYLNVVSNAWVTKSQTQVKSVVDTGGSNSSMLDFDNGVSLTTLGLDKSIKGNNWTLNNMSITAGPTYDWMLDTPSNNFCTLNSLTAGGAATYSNANLQAAISNGASGFSVRSTFFVSSGKWYFESSVVSGANLLFGVGNENAAVNQYLGLNANGWSYNMANGNKITNGVSSAYGATVAIGDVVGVALDMDVGTLTFYKNGVSQGVAFTGLTGALCPMLGNGSSTTVNTGWFNYGQRPFAFTPPTGFLPISSQNLPTPNAAALTPPNQFNIALDTGPAIKTTSEAIFPNNFFEWIKNRGAVDNNQLLDIVRGNTAVLQSNTTSAETTYVAPANASVGWVWKAGGGAVTNTAGTVTSQVSANVQAGFSIVSFNAGLAGNKTIGHGLGKAPDLWIVKGSQIAGSAWQVGCSSFSNPAQGYVNLNTQAALVNDNRMWANAAPTASVFSLESNYTVSASATAVAYCFTNIPGYLKVGSYVGNASADGPFIFCNFRPRYVCIKNISSASDWWVWDTSREINNQMSSPLYPNTTAAETSNAAFNFDILSNGFKMRSTNATVNGTGNTYIYLAIAESTFNYSNAR